MKALCLVCRLFFYSALKFFPFEGKVYCNLCAKFLVATMSTIKQHCVGYFSGKGEQRIIAGHCTRGGEVHLFCNLVGMTSDFFFL